jgi:threonine aldolase
MANDTLSRPVDLRSDTVTRPTPAMRRAMAEAEVGDDERDGDPTVRRLEALTAELLGKEKALFFPSGVMANQSAVWLHTRPGTEILLDSDAHILHWEAAGAAALSGVQVRPVHASNVVMNADDLRRTLRPQSRFAPTPSLVCLENTHNGAGGKVTAVEDVRAIAAVARAAKLPIHLDGARLWNASVATGTTLADLAAPADTVMVSYSKGLGGPIGAALVGAASAIGELWTIRKRFGGALRQAGIVAAGALYGLEHHRERLVDDHENASVFGSMVHGAAGAQVVTPETNIVMIDLPIGIPASRVVGRSAERGVLLTVWTPTRVRAVTHLDVSSDDVRRAAEVVVSVLEDETRRTSSSSGIEAAGAVESASSGH